MKKTALAFALAFMFIFSACGGGAKSSNTGSDSSSGNKGAYNNGEYDSGKPEADNTKGNASQQSTQLVIVNYNLDVECEDVDEAIDKIRGKCDQAGGYVESQESSQYNGNMVLRVPSKAGQEFVDFLDDNFEVDRTQKSTQDITDKYVDNDARLTNLKAEEAQILEVMKKASTVEDILSVQDKLYGVRSEIESLEALKKSWDSQVQYSTIAVNISQKAIVTETKKSIIGGSEFIKAIKKGFTNTAIGLILFLQRLAIFIISNILVLAILAGAVYGAVRISRRKKNRKEPGEADQQK
jgi:hypothetical protein